MKKNPYADKKKKNAIGAHIEYFMKKFSGADMRELDLGLL